MSAPVASVERAGENMLVNTYPVLGPVQLHDLREVSHNLTVSDWLRLLKSASACIVSLKDVMSAKFIPDIVHFHRDWRWDSVTSSILGAEEPWFRCAALAMHPAYPTDTTTEDDGQSFGDSEAVILSS